MTSAREHTARLADLLQRERHDMAEFLVALAEFDERRLWVDLGHSSLFYFLHRELGLSKGAAFYRKTAAELIQKFPEVVEPLRDGRLCLTSIVELSKVLTPENREQVLPRFFLLSKREAKAVCAAIQPDEITPRRDVVTTSRAAPCASADRQRTPEATANRIEPGSDRRKAPDPAPHSRSEGAVHPDEPTHDLAQAGRAGAAELQVAASPTAGDAPATSSPPVAPPAPAPPRPAQRDTVDPLTADLSRLHVTVSRRFVEKLEAAGAALSHSRPGATAAEVLEAGLDLVLARAAKRKGLVEKPRKEPPPSSSDRVPAHVKRAVWARDAGRCQWPLVGGGICGSTLRLQYDHVVPRARGGPSSIENVRILCALHNQLAARRAFGDDWMDRFARKEAGPSAGATPIHATGGGVGGARDFEA